MLGGAEEKRELWQVRELTAPPFPGPPHLGEGQEEAESRALWELTHIYFFSLALEFRLF